MDRDVEDWAKTQGLEVEGWTGSGEFGHAYTTTCGKIIKITNDIQEFSAAFKLQGENNDNIVDIYKAELTENNQLFILMEALDTEGVDDVFNEASRLVDEYSFGEWDYFDPDKVPEDCIFNDNALSMIHDICMSIGELQQKGIDLPDIHDGNIGMKNGRYALFDFQMTEGRSFEDFKEYILKKQNKNLFSRPEISPSNSIF